MRYTKIKKHPGVFKEHLTAFAPGVSVKHIRVEFSGNMKQFQDNPVLPS